VYSTSGTCGRGLGTCREFSVCTLHPAACTILQRVWPHLHGTAVGTPSRAHNTILENSGPMTGHMG